MIKGLETFNKPFMDVQGVPIAVLVRDEAGVTVGGLLGHTNGGWFSVDFLWLPADIRGEGLGTRLMEAAEAEACRQGCVDALVNTGSFQAPGFYERLGYQVCYVLDDYPRGHKRITLRKRLGRAASQSGPSGGR